MHLNSIRNANLDKRYKIWIYRLGLIGLCFSLIGLILIGINANLHWDEDIIKRKKNPKFNGLLEKFFYLMGWLYLLVLLFIGMAFVFEIF